MGSSGALFMRTHRILLVLILLCVPSFAADQWIRITSPNFNVITNAGEKRGREVALRLEQMRRVFTMLIPAEKLRLSLPVQVIAFKDARGLSSVAPIYKGKAVELAGLFQPGDDKNFIALDTSSDNKWTTIYHEYAHLLLNSALPPMPLWFDEGFAEYYSTTSVDKRTIRLGDPPDYATILNDGRMPTDRLFTVGHGSPEYNESGDHRSIFYAQSWLTVHYLIDEKKMNDAANYMKLISGGAQMPAAFQQAFAMSPREFDKVLEHFFREDKYRVWTAPTPGGMEANFYPTGKLKDFEAESVIADMHLHSLDHFEQAKAEFEAVLKASPYNADAYRGLGYYHLRKQDLDNAGMNFRRASELGSTDPRVYYFVAFYMQQKSTGVVPDPEDLVIMNQNLDQAIKTDPSYADAYNLKAFVLARSRNVTEAIRLQKIAIQLAPRNLGFVSNLAGYY